MPHRHIGYAVVRITADAPAPSDHIYATYRSALRAAARLNQRHSGGYTVDARCTCPIPGSDDAPGWDLYRTRHGYSGDR
jgi:hypothetical protein